MEGESRATCGVGSITGCAATSLCSRQDFGNYVASHYPSLGTIPGVHGQCGWVHVLYEACGGIEKLTFIHKTAAPEAGPPSSRQPG
jgi:hypothetical protein